MSKKLILSFIFIVGVVINLYNFTDVFGDTAIPRFRPFGTSTTFADSTNYVTLNKGFYSRDSIKTDKDIIIKGAVRLDTLQQVWMQLTGQSLGIYNNKENGSTELWIGEKSSEYYWYKSSGGAGTLLMTLDTASGLVLNGYNISTSGTGQVKFSKDTVSDYASADAVTINRQSGTVTTKSLTTASGSDYTITVNNSLVSSTTNIWAMIKTNSGAGAPIVRQCASGSGAITIIIRNLGAASLNSAISFQFFIVN